MIRPFFHGFFKILAYHLLFVMGLTGIALGAIFYSDNLVTGGAMAFLVGMTLMGVLQLFYLGPLYVHALLRQRETAFRMGMLAASLTPLGWTALQVLSALD